MRLSSNRALHATLSGWLVGLLAVGPAAAQQSTPLRLVPRVLPTAAASQTVTVIAVPVDGASRNDALRLAYWAEQAVARSGRLGVVRLSEALDVAGTHARQASAAEGDAAVKEGQRAYDELDTQKALQQLDKAVRAFEAGDLSLHFGALSRARVMKAASQVANGDNKAAEQEIHGVLSVDPRAQFSPNFFPPEEMAFVERDRKVLLAGGSDTLRVRTEPVSAQVYVDGQFRGISPLDVTGLTSAEHYVTVVAPGYGLEQKKAKSGEVALTLKSAPTLKQYQDLSDRIARRPDGQERDKALRELAALAGVPQVLGLIVRGGKKGGPLEVTGVRLDATDGHNLAYASGVVPGGEGMATSSQTLLAELVSTDAERVAGKPVTHFASGSSSRRTAGYVLMATGVALLAGGIYFGLEASSQQKEFKDTPQTSSRGQDIKDKGKTYALVADVGVLAGLVAGGLGGYFAFSGGGGGGKSTASRTTSTASPPPRSAPTAAPASETKREALPMPPPPAKTQPRSTSESLPMPPPPSRPAAQTPPPQPAPTKPADSREEELRRRREEVERQRAELEERRKQEEAARQKEAEEKRKREEEEKRKREEEEKRKREEAEKKKKPALDEDDLRNY